ncbi:hypothetical protein F5880DRAFT_1090579 [Lentinula raphanica]|nr:hypothetical protein F5880DRAFT_1090579 [Lentinula raphanica]
MSLFLPPFLFVCRLSPMRRACPKCTWRVLFQLAEIREREQVPLFSPSSQTLIIIPQSSLIQFSQSLQNPSQCIIAHSRPSITHSLFFVHSRMPQQLVYLPPAPVPASPYRKRAVKKLNDRMRTIDHRRALKVIMISSLLHQVKKLAPSQFEFTVQPKSNFHSNHHTKRYFKLKAVKIIEKIITRALTWSDLDKVDLAVYQKVAVQVFISKGLAQVVEHLHPKALSPSSITSLVDGLLIELGRGGGDVTANKVQAVVMVCIKDFGHIYRRWSVSFCLLRLDYEAVDYHIGNHYLDLKGPALKRHKNTCRGLFSTTISLPRPVRPKLRGLHPRVLPRSVVLMMRMSSKSGPPSRKLSLMKSSNGTRTYFSVSVSDSIEFRSNFHILTTIVDTEVRRRMVAQS